MVLRHCTRTEIRTEKTSTSSFLPKAMRLPHSPCFANIANGTLSKNPFNGTAKWIYLFPFPLWVNLQCSAVFSTSTSSFPPKAMRLPRSPCFANIANGTLSKNPFNGTAKWIYLFPFPLWVNLQCSAVFSLVASRNDGHFLRLYKRVPPVNDPTAMPCLWALSKGETAVHDCHCLGDLAVCMREVLARPWDGECVPLVLRF